MADINKPICLQILLINHRFIHQHFHNLLTIILTINIFNCITKVILQILLTIKISIMVIMYNNKVLYFKAIFILNSINNFIQNLLLIESEFIQNNYQNLTILNKKVNPKKILNKYLINNALFVY